MQKSAPILPRHLVEAVEEKHPGTEWYCESYINGCGRAFFVVVLDARGRNAFVAYRTDDKEKNGLGIIEMAQHATRTSAIRTCYDGAMAWLCD